MSSICNQRSAEFAHARRKKVSQIMMGSKISRLHCVTTSVPRQAYVVKRIKISLLYLPVTNARSDLRSQRELTRCSACVCVHALRLVCAPCTCSSCRVFSEMSAWTRTSSLARSCRIDSNSCSTFSISAAFEDTAASASSSCFECGLVWGVVCSCSNLRLISSADNPAQASSTQPFSNVLWFFSRSCRCDSSF